MAVLPIGMSGEAGGYQIERSLRFNSADSAYLSRTPASAGNRKTWTWSGWVKWSSSSTEFHFLSQYTDASNRAYVNFRTSNTLFLFNRSGGTTTAQLETTQVFRDFSAWYHVVIAVDTTQATDSNRIKFYVNGSQITAFSTATYPSQNADLQFNSTGVHRIGSYDGASDFANGYLADVHFIDGSALTPSSFGETDSTTGVWKPKAYTGSYGTNGFYLKFADNSGTTSTTLGKDSSPNGNNWTPNNFSVTAGVGNDSLVDTPTPYGTDTGAGGEVRGNYATLNPLSTPNSTITNGNLNGSTVLGTDSNLRTTIGVSSGKWFVEFTPTVSFVFFIGILPSTATAIDVPGVGANSYGYLSDARKRSDATGYVSYGSSWTTNDVIGVALDLDNGTLTFYKNGVSQGVAFTGLSTSVIYHFAFGEGSGLDSASAILNAGQRPFAYTAPSGFKALCTQNLPEPTVVQGDDYFNTVLYAGNSSTNAITGVGFQPDLLWMKARSNSTSHYLTDAVRGFGKTVFSDLTNAEYDYGSVFTATSDGFTLGNNSGVNNSLHTYVAWNWKANGAGSSNTAGTITSTVSANTTAGFSIVTYTGTGANATVGHGLGVAPSMVIVKSRDAARSWNVWHSAFDGSGYMLMETTNALASEATKWNNTIPTSVVFSLGTQAGTNTNTEKFVAYCFAPVAGFSAFGSYTGNGSADGPFIYTGFRPAFVMVKRTDGVGAWWLFDAARNTYNVLDDYLYANASDAEASDNTLDFVSNGFKLRIATYQPNTSGATFIYAAFAENPFKYALAR